MHHSISPFMYFVFLLTKAFLTIKIVLLILQKFSGNLFKISEEVLIIKMISVGRFIFNAANLLYLYICIEIS